MFVWLPLNAINWCFSLIMCELLLLILLLLWPVFQSSTKAKTTIQTHSTCVEKVCGSYTLQQYIQTYLHTYVHNCLIAVSVWSLFLFYPSSPFGLILTALIFASPYGCSNWCKLLSVSVPTSIFDCWLYCCTLSVVAAVLWIWKLHATTSCIPCLLLVVGFGYNFTSSIFSVARPDFPHWSMTVSLTKPVSVNIFCTFKLDFF